MDEGSMRWDMWLGSRGDKGRWFYLGGGGERNGSTGGSSHLTAKTGGDDL